MVEEKQDTELAEIRLIENEAVVDAAIQKCLDVMREMLRSRNEIDVMIQSMEKRYGQLLAYKMMFGSLKPR